MIKERTGFERTAFIAKLTQAVTMAVKEQLDAATRTCVNCERFNQEKELCGIYNARPPAAVIVIGCEKHKEIDDIPF